ncbi:MAG: HAMP domain-containing sensor histidine kinase [Chitinophagaceae bacterium]
MKLFTRYTRINLLITVVIFLLASGAFYFLLQYVLVDQVDDSLKIEQHEIETYVQTHNRLPEIIPVKDQVIAFKPATEVIEKRHFRTTKVYSEEEKEYEHIRQIFFSITAGNQLYEATVSKSLEETNDIIRSVVIISTVTIVLILISTLLINRFLLRKLWQPFYNTLNVILGFKLGQDQQLSFPATDIDEFSFMNKALQQATGKAEQDYRILKEFTENASHELQTPLAIIRSKLDILIQDEKLSESQSLAVQSADKAVQRLSRLNQSLLLLTKIENKQFADTSSVNMKQKIEEKLLQFQELWENTHLGIDTQLEDVCLQMNAALADILLNNLLSNAIRYTATEGHINIELNKQSLTISNTAIDAALEKTQMFTRFHKPFSTGEGNGLGLSIIKQICDVSGYTINYSFTDRMHRFAINFQ